MKNLLQFLFIVVSITLCVSALAGQSTEDKIKSAGQCMFTDKLIGSVYSGSCMIPMGPSGKTFKFFNNDYKNMGGSAISDVKVEPFDSLHLFEEIKSRRGLLLFNRTIGRDGNHAVFIVLDILKMPKIKKSETPVL